MTTSTVKTLSTLGVEAATEAQECDGDTESAFASLHINCEPPVQCPIQRTMSWWDVGTSLTETDKVDDDASRTVWKGHEKVVQ